MKQKRFPAKNQTLGCYRV